MATAAPKSLKRQKLSAQGVDVSGTAGVIYIVRSDLGCYLKVYMEELGDDIGRFRRFLPYYVFSKAENLPLDLHTQCSGADHYFGFYASTSEPFAKRGELPYMYSLGVSIVSSLRFRPGSHSTFSFGLIKGNNFRIVKNLTTAEDPKTGDLHPDCQRGDFYMAISTIISSKESTFDINMDGYDIQAIFIIIEAKENKFSVFKDLETGEQSQDYKKLYYESDDGPYSLHENCQGGLHYWATSNPVDVDHDSGRISIYRARDNISYYILMGVDDSGNATIHCTNNLRTDEMGYDIIVHSNSVTKFLPGGLSHKLKGQWNLLEVFSAGTKELPWKYEKVVDVGYDKEVLESVEYDWLITDKLRTFQSAVKQKFLFVKESKLEEETTQVVKRNGTVQPHSTVSIWQYVIMLIPENKLLLRTSHVEQTDSDTPPTFEPQGPGTTET